LIAGNTSSQYDNFMAQNKIKSDSDSYNQKKGHTCKTILHLRGELHTGSTELSQICLYKKLNSNY